MCRQISLDCMFLESQQIIDYSLLLGLHFRAPEQLKALLNPGNAMVNEESSSTCNGWYYHLLSINVANSSKLANSASMGICNA